MISNTSDILKALNEKPIHRTFAIDRAAVKPESRTVRIAFASDKPVDHWFGKLSLSMKGKAMRTDRLKSGAPLLVEHDTRDIVGVIEGYSIGIDGIARADVRFGESTRAQEVFKDVKNGIRRNVSVGFLVHKMEVIKEGAKGTLPEYRSEDWQPYEVSLVSVPADISVGVGRARSNNLGNKKMNTYDNTEPSISEQTREIVDFAEIFNQGDLARQMIAASPDVTLDDVRLAIRARQPASVKIQPMDPFTAAARQGVSEFYQPARIVSRVRLQHFSGERAQERAHQFGTWLLGGPLGNSWARGECQRNGWMLQRAQSEGINEKGAFLVPEHFGDDLINLIEENGVFRRNAKVVPMSSDTRSDPRVTGRLTAEFVGESQTKTEQDMEFDRISLVARKTMVLVDFSSEVSEDSTTSIGDTLAGEAARAFAELEDKCGFIGDASSTYGGITGVAEKLKSVDGTIGNIAGLQVGSGNLYTELVLDDFAKTVARLPNYARKSSKWYMNDAVYWNTIVPLLIDAGGVTIGEIEASRGERLFGLPIEFVTVMPSSAANSQVVALVGNLALAASFGDRRLFNISISDAPRFKYDDWTLKATARWDINVHDVGDTTDAGPIVGLITAAA